MGCIMITVNSFKPYPSVGSAARSLGLIVGLLCSGVLLADEAEQAAVSTALLERQRAVFKEVYPQARKGRWQPVAEREGLLQSYILWPDLRAAYLRARMRPENSAEIEAFLGEYGMLKPARDLRYQYALRLATRGKMAAYLALSQEYYQHTKVAKLDCLALQAQIKLGQQDEIVGRAQELWLVGKSQVDECDPVFNFLRETGQLGADLYRQRFELAIDARKYTFARYLAKSIDAEHLSEADAWLASYKQPTKFISNHARYEDSEVTRRQLISALRRISYPRPDRGLVLWRELEPQFDFSPWQSARMSRYIALWSARRHYEDASALLLALPGGAVNEDVRSWTVRAHLRQRDWKGVITAVTSMPAEEKKKEEWRYWLAQAMKETGHGDQAKPMLKAISRKRSYYGFLAADGLGRDYAYANENMKADLAVQASLLEKPSLQRARELFLVGLDGRGRSEWGAAVASLSVADKIQAALLADEWGWHSRAIATAALAGKFNDLRVRFPLPYRSDFVKFAADAQITETWAYGIARNESLFMRDIRSSAGAIGLMQLMPATGRETASAIGYPYSGYATLIDPASNIRLGTAYLGKMYARFGDSQILATAAYNAGPHRVDDWLPDKGSVDARIWVETIPFNETRAYVRRVLEADAVFYWRLTGKTRRVSSVLGDVSTTSGTTRLARAGGV